MEEKYLMELSDEKRNFVEKYSMKLSKDLRWYSDKNNSIARTYFRHNFLLENGMLEILLRKYQICFAKLKYFRIHLQEYEFYKYDPFKGFVSSELWDTEFLKHKKSGRYIDLRYLSEITKIAVFEELIRSLEEIES